MSKGPNQSLLFFRIHLRVADEHGFAAAMGESRRRILQGHGPGQTSAFKHAHILCHAQAADGRAGGDIVHYKDSFETKMRLLNMNDFCRS